MWISPEPRGHLQATGRDAKGRKQYRYHADWRAHCESMKYERLIEFGEALPDLRRGIAADLRRRGLPREKVVATVVHLLETSLIRVGNEAYAKANGSFGLTTLRSRQVDVHGADAAVPVPGQERPVARGRGARPAGRRRRAAVPGPARASSSSSTRPRTAGDGSTRTTSTPTSATRAARTSPSKDFRTWMGTLMAATALATLEPPRSDAAARRQAAAAIKVVARHLGNTPTVARTSYVHPDVVDLYVEGDLEELWAKGPARDTRWLVVEERKLLAVLRAAHRRQRQATRAKAA